MLAETMKIVPIAHANDLNVNATQECDSINLSGFHKVTFIVQYHTLGVADHDIRVQSGLTNAALTTEMPFRYAFGGAAQGAANCDVLAAWATSTDLRVTQATYSDYMLVIEVEAADLRLDHQWVTLQTADTVTNATGLYTAFAILAPRYADNRSATALA